MSGPATDVTDVLEVVVAVDGSEAADRAVEHAVAVARAERRPLRLVHVVPQIGPLSTLSLVLADVVAEKGRSYLDGMVARTRALAPELDVRHSLRFGPRNAELVHAARQAAVVVLGRRQSVHHHPRSTGSTAATLAAVVDCPVRVVPSDVGGRDLTHRIVVGVKDARSSVALVRRALDLAQASGSRLLLAHAWELPPGYEGVLTPEQVTERNAHAAADLEHAITDVRLAAPRVPVDAVVRVGRPHELLTTLAQDADLLLVGRPAHQGLLTHTGRTTRALLQGSAAPVEIGPRTSDPVAPTNDLFLEQDGALLR